MSVERGGAREVHTSTYNAELIWECFFVVAMVEKVSQKGLIGEGRRERMCALPSSSSINPQP